VSPVQLTMRTFHTGGVAGNDITQGLPRVEELFEARSPKKPAMVAEFDGIVRIDDTKKQRHLILTGNGEGEEKSYTIPYGTHLKVADGDAVIKGQLLTEGVKKPTDIVRVDGLAAAYEYIIKEVQRVYRLQAVEINDKHIEVIARQMTRKVRVENPGSTNLLAGALCDITEFNEENEAVQKRLDAGEAGLALAESSPVLLGITKASLSTESFLSAASFQETTKVLTEAAIKGKIDPLLGLKENVIIGKLIPAGTGMNYYNDVEVEETEKNKEDMPEGKYMDTLDLAEEVKSSYEYDPMEDEGEFEENEFDEADEELSDEDEELYDDDFDDEDEEFPEDEE